jgi:hypothetical protein
MKEALSSSETSVLTRAIRRNIPEDTILRGVYWPAEDLPISHKGSWTVCCSYILEHSPEWGSPRTEWQYRGVMWQVHTVMNMEGRDGKSPRDSSAWQTKFRGPIRNKFYLMILTTLLHGIETCVWEVKMEVEFNQLQVVHCPQFNIVRLWI